MQKGKVITMTVPFNTEYERLWQKNRKPSAGEMPAFRQSRQNN